MASELLPTDQPIEAGPIIIDEWGLDTHNHINYTDFVREALGRNMSQRKATHAMRLAVSSLIRQLDLGILPPYEHTEEDEPWGPYDAHDYFIDPHGYVERAAAIEEDVENETSDGDIKVVLRGIRTLAEEEIRFNKDRMPFSELSDAFYTPRYPSKHMATGKLLSLADFQDGARGIDTSHAKATSVFDIMIARCGDEEARKWIEYLEITANPRDRRQVRDSLYIKIQPIVDFLDTVQVLPADKREGFNAISLKLLRYIVSEEERE